MQKKTQEKKQQMMRGLFVAAATTTAVAIAEAAYIVFMKLHAPSTTVVTRITALRNNDDAEIRTMRERLAYYNSQSESYQENLMTLLRRENDLRLRTGFLDQNEKRYQDNLAALNKRRDATERCIHNLLARKRAFDLYKENFEKINVDLENMLQSQKNDFRVAMDEMKKSLEVLRIKADVFEKQAGVECQRNKELQEQIKNMQTDLDKNNEKIRTLESELMVSKIRHSGHQEKIGILQSEIQEAGNVRMHMQAEIHRLNDEALISQKRNHEFQEEIKKLKLEKQAIIDDIEPLKKQLRDSQAIIEVVRAENRHLQRDHGAFLQRHSEQLAALKKKYEI